MTLYFLDYDLRKQRDYQKLYDELARIGAVRILQSLWCFKATNTNDASMESRTAYEFRHFADWLRRTIQQTTKEDQQDPQ